MISALEWISMQLVAAFNTARAFLESFTYDVIAVFLEGSIVYPILFFALGLTLAVYGLRTYKLVSGTVSSTFMGILGFQIGSNISPDLIIAAIMFMLLFLIVGFAVFYKLWIVSAFLLVFLFTWIVMQEILAIYLIFQFIISVLAGLLYCIFLARRNHIRTPISGGMILGVVSLFLFDNIFVALCIAIALAVGGAFLQTYLKKKGFVKKRPKKGSRPKAPVFPVDEGIDPMAIEGTEELTEGQDGTILERHAETEAENEFEPVIESEAETRRGPQAKVVPMAKLVVKPKPKPKLNAEPAARPKVRLKPKGK